MRLIRLLGAVLVVPLGELRDRHDAVSLRHVDQPDALGRAAGQAARIILAGFLDQHVLLPAELQVRHCPGHTPGHVVFFSRRARVAFVGDVLFAGSIGRTDLPGGNPRQILRSIEDKLLPLPEETIVVPGHGPNTTIGREKERNFFLRGL